MRLNTSPEDDRRREIMSCIVDMLESVGGMAEAGSLDTIKAQVQQAMEKAAKRVNDTLWPNTVTIVHLDGTDVFALKVRDHQRVFVSDLNGAAAFLMGMTSGVSLAQTHAEDG